MNITIQDIDDIPRAARAFTAAMGNHNVFAFYGSMGAGKTTFIKAICQELGVTETVASPTFSIVNEYRDAQGRSIYHFDFYRINKLEEVFDFGYEDYFYSGNRCFIEWPELVESILPQECIRVHIQVNDDGSRNVTQKTNNL